MTITNIPQYDVAHRRDQYGPTDAPSVRRVKSVTVQALALAVIATSVVIGGSASPALAYPAKRTTDTSYYISTSNTTTAYNDGCSQGTKDAGIGASKDSRVVLAFGAQKSDFSGTLLPATATSISNASLEAVAEQFGLGYYACTGADTGSLLFMDLSTNTSGSTVTNAAGVSWAHIVDAVGTWGTNNGTASQVIVNGANDIEPSWSSYSSALAWATGFQATTSRQYVNTASADGCPQTTHTNGGCNNGWNQFDVWKLSWGMTAALCAPQIYFQAQANQWNQLTLYGYNSQSAPILFTAPLDEHPADTSTFTSTQAWNALVSLIYGSSTTSYDPPFSMEIRYE